MSDLNLPQPALAGAIWDTLFQVIRDATFNADLSPIDIYDIDNVDASVLPHLAEQFDVLGFKGWALADTDAKRRTLLKNAVKIHSTAGTPFSVLTALNSVGFGGAALEENPPLLADGSVEANGTESATGQKWARFRVTFASPLPADKTDLVESLINVWKPARSHLIWEVGLLVADGYAVADGSEVADGYQ